MEPNSSEAHYNAAYFAWHAPIGDFGGWANLSKFAAYVRPSDTVLDFGCGGGQLLANLRCAARIGVEVNASALVAAQQRGIQMYSRAAELPPSCADVSISNNALEHTAHPLAELQALHRALRPGGTIVCVVPCEQIGYRYRPGDINRHLYSWSPMCLGNLFDEAGFAVVEAKPYIHKWPPGYRLIARLAGRQGFELACRLYGQLARSWFQVRVVARRP